MTRPNQGLSSLALGGGERETLGTRLRVYQELVYRNRPLKKMLTGSAVLSLPSPFAFFSHSFSQFTLSPLSRSLEQAIIVSDSVNDKNWQYMQCNTKKIAYFPVRLNCSDFLKSIKTEELPSFNWGI